MRSSHGRWPGASPYPLSDSVGRSATSSCVRWPVAISQHSRPDCYSTLRPRPRQARRDESDSSAALAAALVLKLVWCTK
eukprot:6054258-Prymnesium_polylepis.1